MKNDPLPLFPLHVVLLPEEILPLHIFEERYKEMIEMCQNEGLPFGVVLAEESGIRQIGCTARIAEVTQKFPDGRMNIVTRGEERFRIRQTYDEKSYLTAEVELFGDSEAEPPSENLVNEVVQAFRANTKNPDFLSEDLIEDPARLSFIIGAALQLPLRDKQAFLESDSPGERLRSLVRLIQEKRHRNEQASGLNEAAARNGHPKKSQGS